MNSRSRLGRPRKLEQGRLPRRKNFAIVSIDIDHRHRAFVDRAHRAFVDRTSIGKTAPGRSGKLGGRSTVRLYAKVYRTKVYGLVIRHGLATDSAHRATQPTRMQTRVYVPLLCRPARCTAHCARGPAAACTQAHAAARLCRHSGAHRISAML